jgi:hypothetical protein
MTIVMGIKMVPLGFGVLADELGQTPSPTSTWDLAMELFPPFRVQVRGRPRIPLVEVVGGRHPVSNPHTNGDQEMHTRRDRRRLRATPLVGFRFTFHNLAARILRMDGG